MDALDVVTAAAAAAVATLAKTKAEQVMQPAAEKLLPPGPAEKTTLGGDPAGHPENMPPAEVADRAVQVGLHRDLSDDQRETASSVLHWVMGVGFGVGYGLLGRRVPAVRAGRGTAAGAALFLGTHASVLPAAGVQHPPSQLPRAWWLWEGGSHLVYGAVLDGTLSLLDGLRARRR